MVSLMQLDLQRLSICILVLGLEILASPRTGSSWFKLSDLTACIVCDNDVAAFDGRFDKSCNSICPETIVRSPAVMVLDNASSMSEPCPMKRELPLSECAAESV